MVSAGLLSPDGEEQPAGPGEPGWWVLPGTGGGVVLHLGKFGFEPRVGNWKDCGWPEGAMLTRGDEGSTLGSPERQRGRGRSASAHSSFGRARFSECGR